MTTKQVALSYTTTATTDLTIDVEVPPGTTEAEIKAMIADGHIDWLEHVNQQYNIFELDQVSTLEHRQLLSVELAAPSVAELEAELARAREFLKIQEGRLHRIEEVLDGWSTEPDDGEPVSQKFLNHEDRLQKVQEACPWDDDNEGDSWYFKPGEDKNE
jgi:hypothetical protein